MKYLSFFILLNFSLFLIGCEEVSPDENEQYEYSELFLYENFLNQLIATDGEYMIDELDDSQSEVNFYELETQQLINRRTEINGIIGRIGPPIPPIPCVCINNDLRQILVPKEVRSIDMNISFDGETISTISGTNESMESYNEDYNMLPINLSSYEGQTVLVRIARYDGNEFVEYASDLQVR